MNKKGFLQYIIIIVVVGILALVGILYLQNQEWNQLQIPKQQIQK